MKTKIQNVRWQRLLPFAVLAILIAIAQLRRGALGDDFFFGSVLNDQSNMLAAAVDFIVGRYTTWCSRQVIEFVLIFLIRVPWLWKILDTAVMVWIAVGLSFFFNREKRSAVDWMIVLFVLSFPISSMSTAGWITTSLNYSWVLAAGLAALVPFRYLVQGERVPVWCYVLSFPALLYAISQEQMCAIIFALSLIFAAYIFVKYKRVSWFGLSQAGLSVAGMVVIFLCPGNAVRTRVEIDYWFPEYANLSFLHKIELGYSRAMYEFVMRPNLVFALFCGLLLLAVCVGNRKRIYRWITAVPFAVSLVMGLFFDVLGESLPALAALRNALGVTGTGFVLHSPSTWLPVLFVTAVGGCVLIGLYAVFGKTPQTLLAALLLAGGLASAWIMGFSPTVWASNNRTFIFMYMAFISVGAMLYNRMAKQPMPSHLKTPAAAYLAVHLAFTANQYLSLL